MRKLLEPVCLSFFVIMSSPCEMAFAEDVLSGINNFEIARIERDIQDLRRSFRERNSDTYSILWFWFHDNHRQVTGTLEDLITFADLFAGLPLAKQQGSMERFIPLPSRRFIEILGSGHGRDLLARCPVDARGFVDCH